MLKVGDLVLFKTLEEFNNSRAKSCENHTNLAEEMKICMGTVCKISKIARNGGAFEVEGAFWFWRRDSIQAISRRKPLIL